MRRIILALLLVFPLSGYGQTAKYILDGNDDVKIEFFNSTNVLVISNAILTNSSSFRNALSLGPTNAVSFGRVVSSGPVTFGNDNATGANGSIRTAIANGQEIEFSTTGSVRATLGPVNFTLTQSNGALSFGAGNTTGAGLTRSNLGLGGTWLTNNTTEFFRRDIGLGATNSVRFSSVLVDEGISYGSGNSVAISSGAPGVFISKDGISFRDGVLPAGVLPATANTTRTNLGLGAPWLTNTNTGLFARDLGLGKTNSVSFRQVDIDWTIGIDANGQFIYSPGAVLISIRQDGIYFSDGAPTMGLPTTALNTRKNLGFDTNLNTFWSATNTDSLQSALFNSSSLNAQGQRITNLAAPINDNDAATRAYVFGLFSRVAPSVSFGNTTDTVEIGSMIMSVSLSWSISPTNTPVSSQSISASQGTFNAINTTSRTTTAFIPGPPGFPNQPFTSDTTWTLTVNDGTGLPGSTVTTSTGIAFRHYMSWGIASTTSLDNSQIQNLHTNTAAGAGREFRTAKGKSVSISGNGQYIYFAYPASFGAASFIVNNAPNTAWISNTITYTNSSGNSSQFLIYRSTDVQFGTSIPITIN